MRILGIVLALSLVPACASEASHAGPIYPGRADGVSFVRGPVASLLSAGYVAVVASLLATVFQRESGAYVLAAGGVVLGQGRLLVHPDGILHEWRRYWFLHPDAGCEPVVRPTSIALNWSVGPAAMPGGGGLGISLSF